MSKALPKSKRTKYLPEQAFISALLAKTVLLFVQYLMLVDILCKIKKKQ